MLGRVQTSQARPHKRPALFYLWMLPLLICKCCSLCLAHCSPPSSSPTVSWLTSFPLQVTKSSVPAAIIPRSPMKQTWQSAPLTQGIAYQTNTVIGYLYSDSTGILSPLGLS